MDQGPMPRLLSACMVRWWERVTLFCEEGVFVQLAWLGKGWLDRGAPGGEIWEGRDLRCIFLLACPGRRSRVLRWTLRTLRTLLER